MKLHHRITTKPYIISGSIAFLVGAAAVVLINENTSAPKSNTRVAQSVESLQEVRDEPQPVVEQFDKTVNSTTDPASLWIVVNKQNPLTPIDFTPSDLVAGPQGSLVSARVNPDLNAMINAAAQEAVTLSISSSYRSYANQATLYTNYVAQYGQELADTISARAGYSEHQTGLAVDIGGITQPDCNFNECFGETIEGQWLRDNVTKFGFIIRYTENNGDVAGYAAEPWHLRYIGKELATELKTQNVTTLEEFFEIAGGRVYASN